MLRCLSAQEIADDPTWRFAPIVVASHCERDALNVEQLKQFAKAFGLPIVRWKLELNKSHEALLRGLSERERDLVYASEPALWAYFCEGVPVLISSTVRSTRKLVNGSPALLVRLAKWMERRG